MAFLSQTWALMSKNFRILFLRRYLITIFMALVLPIALTVLLTYSRNFFIPPSHYGFGVARPVMSLADALRTASPARNKLIMVNAVDNGSSSESTIETVMDRVEAGIANEAAAIGTTIMRLYDEALLAAECPASIRGVSRCFGAVVFRSEPSEQPPPSQDSSSSATAAALWRYTIRTDWALNAIRVDVDKPDNDPQVYLLPLQRAVDAAIVQVGGTDGRDDLDLDLDSDGANDNATSNDSPLDHTLEYPYTNLSQEELEDQIRRGFQSAIMNYAAVAFMTSVLFITYHLTGFVASERESGMAQLIDSMLPARRMWHARAVRIVAHHLSFSLAYLPGWVIGSVILSAGLFTRTSVAVGLFYHLLSGLAMASISILFASFFRRAQLSGSTAVLSVALLGIVAQSLTRPETAVVAALSALFTPCNYVFFIATVARWQQQDLPADLASVAPDSPSDVPGVVFFVLLVVQIFAYPLLGGLIEATLYGTTSSGRTVVVAPSSSSSSSPPSSASYSPLAPDVAVRLDGFTKIYKPSFLRRTFSFVSRPREPVVAVDKLTFSAGRGQIIALLGANGSGKSTTLDCIAGMNRMTSGSIAIDGAGGLGIAPQKNVLWDSLTVEEHVHIFSRLKATASGPTPTRDQVWDVVRAVDLWPKLKARAGTLSGGQKRKLQLAMMLTGGSAVCCIDEVSSGLDPLSRRKIWDILLAERGRRTLILTTHFLDEADLLADHIAVLSKGVLRTDGTSAELKNRFGGGYRIFAPRGARARTDDDDTPAAVAGVDKRVGIDEVTYLAPSSRLAADVVRALEAAGIRGYRFAGPTIEDVFLKLAEEVQELHGIDNGEEKGKVKTTTTDDSSGNEIFGNKSARASPGTTSPRGSAGAGLALANGSRVGYLAQVAILYRKRLTVFRRNWLIYLAAFLLPVIGAGLVTLFLRGQEPTGCTPGSGETGVIPDSFDLFNRLDPDLLGLSFVFGPRSRTNVLARLTPILNQASGNVDNTSSSDGDGNGNGNGGGGGGGDVTSLLDTLTVVDTLDELNDYIRDNRENLWAGIWAGDETSPPLFAAVANRLFPFSMGVQTVLDNMLTGANITTDWSSLDRPWTPSMGNSLQVLVYMGIALAVFPAFFALYPSAERRWLVRGFEYSNGVRPLPLWAAYLAFDFGIALVAVAIAVGLWAGLSSIWWNIGYVFVVFVLYALASTLLAYVMSLVGKSQLSTYAYAAGLQLLIFLVYLIAYLCILTYTPVDQVDSALRIAHFVMSLAAPIASATRAMMLALNIFSTACDGNQLAEYAGGINQYGGPVLYLVVQSAALLALLLWIDSGAAARPTGKLAFWRWRQSRSRSPRSGSEREEEDNMDVSDEEVAHEETRVVTAANNNDNDNAEADGLRVVHLTKTFGKTTAVDNITFGIRPGEVFALLGPNGAGKSTTISLVRGDLRPDAASGDVFVGAASVTRELALARSRLGVCPQADALDLLTVREHLEFYARVRGVADVRHNVDAVMDAVGLGAFATRMAHALSGGNKRKLSLGIALMGNPDVVLLDEPSSGLDAAAKRIMWRTLAATTAGRSIMLTTHSMEEASALASRAGILAGRMLALGTTEGLRRRFGDALHVHLVSTTAPRTTDAEMDAIRTWLVATFSGGAEVEHKTYHGQLRFSVSPAAVMAATIDGIQGVGSRGVHREEGGEAKDEEENQAEDQEKHSTQRAETISDSIDHPTDYPMDNLTDNNSASAIGRLVILLEVSKEALGIGHYSVSPATLDQVFLTIVGRHNVQEENYERRSRGG